MKDLINFVLILATLLLIWRVCSNNNPIDIYLYEDAMMKRNVGKKVLFKGDSLTVIDYSFWKSSYTLEDGTTVNSKLINK